MTFYMMSMLIPYPIDLGMGNVEDVRKHFLCQRGERGRNAPNPARNREIEQGMWNSRITSFPTLGSRMSGAVRWGRDCAWTAHMHRLAAILRTKLVPGTENGNFFRINLQQKFSGSNHWKSMLNRSLGDIYSDVIYWKSVLNFYPKSDPRQ